IFTAPIIWVAFDWLRGAVTGMDWNALGYSQAFHPLMIWSSHPAAIHLSTIGGVYAVTFSIVLADAAIAFAFIRRRSRSMIVSVVVLVGLAVVTILSNPTSVTIRRRLDFTNDTLVIGIQPNVPMVDVGESGYRQLLERHVELSETALSSEGLQRFRH